MTEAEARRLHELGREAVLTGPKATDWLERLRPERENLRDAIDWLAGNGELDAATNLAVSVWRLWLLEGQIPEVRQLLARVLDRTSDAPPSSSRAQALYADGLLAFREGDQAHSAMRNQEALAVARAISDAAAEALALVGLSRVAFREGDYDHVQVLAQKARDLTHRLDASDDVVPLHMLAAGTRLSGEYKRAETLYLESLTLNRKLGDTYMCCVELHNLGHVSIHRGDLEAAAAYFSECAELRKGSNDPYDAAMESLNAAAMSFQELDPDRATSLLAEAEARLEGVGIVLDPDDQFEVDWLHEQLAQQP